MKKTFLLLFFINLLLSCNSDTTNTKKVTISGNIKNTFSNKHVYLKVLENNQLKTIDTANLTSGNFTFETNVEKPKVYALFVDKNKNGIYPIIAEPSVIKIKADLNNTGNFYAEGTRQNELFQQYRKDTDRLSKKMSSLFNSIQIARATDDLKKLIELNTTLKKLNQKNNEYSLNFVNQNSNLLIASMVLYSLIDNPDIDEKEIEDAYFNLSLEVRTNQFSEKIENYLKQTD